MMSAGDGLCPRSTISSREESALLGEVCGYSTSNKTYLLFSLTMIGGCCEVPGLQSERRSLFPVNIRVCATCTRPGPDLRVGPEAMPTNF